MYDETKSLIATSIYDSGLDSTDIAKIVVFKTLGRSDGFLLIQNKGEC